MSHDQVTEFEQPRKGLLREVYQLLLSVIVPVVLTLNAPLCRFPEPVNVVVPLALPESPDELSSPLVSVPSIQLVSPESSKELSELFSTSASVPL